MQLEKIHANSTAHLSLKLLRIQARLEEIEFLLKCYQESIALLTAYATGKETLKRKGCTDSAARYQRTQEDEKRFPETIFNLRLQIAVLKKEREVLIEYAH